MENKRILITGATGFIGRALADDLARAAYEVTALTRNPGRNGGLFKEGIIFKKWDGRTREGWGSLADGALAIINLAGDNLAQGRWTRAKKDRILRSRLEAGSAVLQAIKEAKFKPRVIVQASAVGAYGSRGDEIVDERSSTGKGFLAEVVRQWEDSTREAEAWGVRRVIIRSGLVLGKDAGVLPRLCGPFRFFAGGPLGNGRQGFSWIHLQDEVRAIRFLLESDDLSGVFNLTAPNPLPQKAFCRALGAAIGRPCWLPMPALALRLLFGEKARETLLAGQMVYARRLLESGFEYMFPHAESALENLLTG